MSSDASSHGDRVQDLSGPEGHRRDQATDYRHWSTEDLIREAEKKRTMVRLLTRDGWTDDDRRWFRNDESFDIAVRIERNVIEECRNSLDAIEREAFRRLGRILSTKPQVE